MGFITNTVVEEEKYAETQENMCGWRCWGSAHTADCEETRPQDGSLPIVWEGVVRYEHGKTPEDLPTLMEGHIP